MSAIATTVFPGANTTSGYPQRRARSMSTWAAAVYAVSCSWSKSVGWAAPTVLCRKTMRLVGTAHPTILIPRGDDSRYSWPGVELIAVSVVQCTHGTHSGD